MLLSRILRWPAQRLALSRERRHSHLVVSRNQDAPLVALQRRVTPPGCVSMSALPRLQTAVVH